MINLIETVDNIVKTIDYKSNPYFISLENRSMSKEEFIETQKQFYYAVTFFSRPMGVLATKIPTPQQRLEVVRNFWEEHGEGDVGSMHQSTFMQFLNRLTPMEPTALDEIHLATYVRVFNTVLLGTCTLEDYKIGVAMMGIIEYMFSDISGMIGRAIVQNGWLKEEEMIHYNLHEALDVKHSKDFFDIIQTDWNDSQESKHLIQQGLELGAFIFNNLYKDMHAFRHR